mmetsp:Transcript_5067/g.9753  ORF Transcript_5067/g.9753 Transcript_5067/m.9753 type:complete len:901 (-) Transcript_5067:222-2924(-)
MAMLSYCIFADESVKDTVTAVELWPKIKKVRKDDNVHRIMLSCAMRFFQGMLATLVVLLLVISTQDAIDIILNFTAVNFISGFDDVAFELAHWGKYGPKMEAEAKRIEDLTVPLCLHRKYHHVRYRYTIIPIALILVGMLTTITYNQASTKVWLTQRLRVQFEDDTIHEEYSGCYIINDSSTENRAKNKRVVYDSYEKNGVVAKFGYCEKQKKWILYDGDSLDPCNVKENVALSDRTSSFDIGTSFEGTWASASGTPLELYFFQDEDILNEEQCDSFLGDGICNTNLNTPDYDFDSGDCCAVTCDEADCGLSTMKKAFDTDIGSGDGYPNCKDPSMVPITIYLNNIYREEALIVDQEGIFANAKPRDPLLIFDCEGDQGNNLLMVSIDVAMMNKTETVMVADGASCSIMIKNVTSEQIDIWFVDYTIYHGDKESIENDPIVITTGSSFEKEVTEFQRIPDCFITKLGDYVNKTTIYTGTDPSNQAINWLLGDSLGFSLCKRRNFIERYALAAMNFAAPVMEDRTKQTDTNTFGLWINERKQCAWRTVLCVDGMVSELDLGFASGIYLSGTMATEIGLLKNLRKLDMSYNYLSGTIPLEIEGWKKLEGLNIGVNKFTGAIPSEIAQLTSLQWLMINNNNFNGTIPTILAEMPSIKMLSMFANLFTGSLPDEIGSMSKLQWVIFSDNSLTGAIPSIYGDLQDLKHLALSKNSITGTIPSELGRLKNLERIELDLNKLTGSIPDELLDRNETLIDIDIDIYGNQLSGLIPVEGEVICSARGGEHYCNCDVDCALNKKRCRCEEGRSCCESFFEQFTECIVCKQNRLQNPGFYIRAKDTTCLSDADRIRGNLLEFGTDELCEGAKNQFKDLGCLCLEEYPNSNSGVFSPNSTNATSDLRNSVGV